MDLEDLLPSEIGHKKKNIIQFHLYVESKYNTGEWTNRNRLRNAENKLVAAKRDGGGGMGGISEGA